MPKLIDDTDKHIGLYTDGGNELDKLVTSFLRGVVHDFVEKGYSPMEIKIVVLESLFELVRKEVYDHNRPSYPLRNMRFGNKE